MHTLNLESIFTTMIQGLVPDVRDLNALEKFIALHGVISLNSLDAHNVFLKNLLPILNSLDMSIYKKDRLEYMRYVTYVVRPKLYKSTIK